MTSDKELLGYLFIAGDRELSEYSEPADSIFSGVPARSDLFDHPLGSIIQDNKHVEEACVIAKSPGAISVSRPVSELYELCLSVVADGEGEFRFRRSIDGAMVGRGVCKLIGKR